MKENLTIEGLLNIGFLRYRAVVGLNKTGDGELPTILGDKQMADFTTWVGKVRRQCATGLAYSNRDLPV